MLDRGLQVVKRRAVYYTARLPCGPVLGPSALPLRNRREASKNSKSGMTRRM